MTKSFYGDILNQIKIALGQIKTINTTRGVKRAFITTIDHILEQFIPMGYGFKLDLDELNYSPPHKNLEFKRMSIKDLDIILGTYTGEIGNRVQQDLYEKLKNPQCDGFIVKKDNEIYGYCFLNYKFNKPNLNNKYIDTKYNGYLNTDFVFKKYRGENLQEYQIYKRLETLKQKNYKTATCLLHKTNYPSIITYKKFGFKQYVICSYFQFGKYIKSNIHYKFK
jgi:hypothetical protein